LAIAKDSVRLKPMTPLPSHQSELVEEALGDIYECREENVVTTEAVIAVLDKNTQPKILEELIQKRLVETTDGQVRFSSEGEQIASHVIRRKRLAERLLKDVLNLSDEHVDPAACQWEHVLSKEVTNSICTFLGHPSQSPTDKAIPPGECCQASAQEVAPIICSLDKLGAGEKGKITYLLLKRNPDLHRLLSMGLAPGAIVEVLQRYPTFVIDVNESQLAFDKSIAESIFVHPVSHA
jgi:DtxR family Mn-dependent transcriptional regulator